MAKYSKYRKQILDPIASKNGFLLMLATSKLLWDDCKCKITENYTNVYGPLFLCESYTFIFGINIKRSFYFLLIYLGHYSTYVILAFNGISVQATCHCCGLRIDPLKTDRSLWKIHAALSKRCKYLESRKGLQYIDKIQKVRTYGNQINYVILTIKH